MTFIVSFVFKAEVDRYLVEQGDGQHEGTAPPGPRTVMGLWNRKTLHSRASGFDHCRFRNSELFRVSMFELSSFEVDSNFALQISS